MSVRVERLTRDFTTGGLVIPVLRGIDLAIERGERVALLGRSGSGKSTLLNLLAGLDRPSSGAIHVAGSDLAALTSDELARYRLREVGVIFQAFHLVPSQTARENVELPLRFAGVPQRERRARAVEMLAGVGLSHRLEHRPSELSGGERQRVAIARALIHRPGLLLADEPTGNLDSATGDEIIQLLERFYREQSFTLILVTHDSGLARRATQRIIEIRDGRIHANAPGAPTDSAI